MNNCAMVYLTHILLNPKLSHFPPLFILFVCFLIFSLFNFQTIGFDLSIYFVVISLAAVIYLFIYFFFKILLQPNYKLIGLKASVESSIACNWKSNLKLRESLKLWSPTIPRDLMMMIMATWRFMACLDGGGKEGKWRGVE